MNVTASSDVIISHRPSVSRAYTYIHTYIHTHTYTNIHTMIIRVPVLIYERDSILRCHHITQAICSKGTYIYIYTHTHTYIPWSSESQCSYMNVTASSDFITSHKPSVASSTKCSEEFLSITLVSGSGGMNFFKATSPSALCMYVCVYVCMCVYMCKDFSPSL